MPRTACRMTQIDTWALDPLKESLACRIRPVFLNRDGLNTKPRDGGTVCNPHPPAYDCMTVEFAQYVWMARRLTAP